MGLRHSFFLLGAGHRVGVTLLIVQLPETVLTGWTMSMQSEASWARGWARDAVWSHQGVQGLRRHLRSNRLYWGQQVMGRTR